MSTTSRVAGAVAAGYVLGRFKKLRLAVLVGSAMSNKKLRDAATDWVQRRAPGGAVGRVLTQEVGGRLVDAGKAAATSAAAARVDALSDRLATRSERLRGHDEDSDEDVDSATAEDEESAHEDESVETADESYEDDEDLRDQEDEEPVTRSSRRRRSASPARGGD